MSPGMIQVGISTWSVHRAIASGSLDLLDVPRQLRARGMSQLQICHFHLKSREDDYLAALRARLDESDVALDALLLDFGDISHEITGDADARELADWLPTAARLGARFARISAGSQPPIGPSLACAAAHLDRLATIGAGLGVRVITENWHAMMPSSREVLRIVELTNGRVPLCLDFGNWTGPGRHAELEAIVAHAVTVHAKCAFSADGVADEGDFRRCLEILRTARFDGTIALIYDGPPTDEWTFIRKELEIVEEVFVGA